MSCRTIFVDVMDNFLNRLAFSCLRCAMCHRLSWRRWLTWVNRFCWRRWLTWVNRLCWRRWLTWVNWFCWLRRLWMNIPSVRFTAGYINDISNNIPININSSINSRVRC